MAGKRIIELNPATTPLAGTEALPLAQSGGTVQISVANLTAGRSIAASQLLVDNASTSPAVRITQTGTGNALLVEDSANPDSTPFIIDGSGNVGIGTTTPGTHFNVSVNSTSDAIRVTQTGTGNALVVEDSANPDSTPFVVDASGNVGVGTTTPGAPLNVVSASSGDAVRITQTGTGNALLVEDSANPDSTPFVIDNNGFVVRGATTALTTGVTYTNATGTALANQMHGSSVTSAAIWVGNWASSGTSGGLSFTKSRSPTVGTQTTVQNGDDLGAISFAGTDGTNFLNAAVILAEVDAAPGTNDMPGRLSFWTTADGASTPTERMRIDSAGFVGIATTSPSTRLNVVGHNEFSLGFTAQTASTQTAITSHPVSALANTDPTVGNGLGLRYQIADTGSTLRTAGGIGMVSTAKTASTVTADMYFLVGTTERIRIDSSGRFFVGTTSSPAAVGGKGVMLENNAGTNGRMIIGKTLSGSVDALANYYNGTYVGGIVYSDTATSFPTSSDVRLKHDIVDAPEASDLIDAIKVRSFKWNLDESEQRFGFIAQELVEVAPEAVIQPADPEAMLGVDFSKLVPMLVKEIQSLRARVAQLENT